MDVTHSRAPRVLVMMATYNGERYLREQIESILVQEDVNVTLRICDDCSTDATMQIANEYAASFSNVIVSKNTHNVGVSENFMQMLYEDGAEHYDYYAFADQDDLWLPEKLSVACRALGEHSDVEPCLYYSNLYNCDENLENPSLGVTGFASCEQRHGVVLARNWENGCVMVFNRALCMLLRQCRPQTWPRIHDAWVHLVARYCGTVVPDYDHALILRRIHGSNVVGQADANYRSPRAASNAVRQAFEPTEHEWLHAAQLLSDNYRDCIHPALLPTLDEFLQYGDSLRNRIHIAFDSDFRMPTLGMRLTTAYMALSGRW